MAQNICSNCGLPDGEHYNICFNSPHYYSPEQERADDVFYGDDDNRERYAATIASMQYEMDYDDEPEIPFDPPVLPQVTDTDDIPF